MHVDDLSVDQLEIVSPPGNFVYFPDRTLLPAGFHRVFGPRDALLDRLVLENYSGGEQFRLAAQANRLPHTLNLKFVEVAVRLAGSSSPVHLVDEQLQAEGLLTHPFHHFAVRHLSQLLVYLGHSKSFPQGELCRIRFSNIRARQLDDTLLVEVDELSDFLLVVDHLAPAILLYSETEGEGEFDLGNDRSEFLELVEEPQPIVQFLRLFVHLMIDHEEHKRQIIQDIAVRFIVNLPKSELQLERIWTHVQLASWYYIDFVKKTTEKVDTDYEYKQFSQKLIALCPAIRIKLTALQSSFYRFNSSISSFGAILLNSEMDRVLLVDHIQYKGFFSFPKGKPNEGESGVQCAIREVWEEVSYNIKGKVNKGDVIKSKKSKLTTFYIVKDVQTDFNFRTKTQGEINSIEWFSLKSLQKQTSKFKYPEIIIALKAWIDKERQLMILDQRPGWQPLKLNANPWLEFKLDRALIQSIVCES